MRVHVHRQVEFLAQRHNQLGSGLRAEQTGHILDGKDMGSGLYNLLGQLEVVIQRVQVLLRRRKVTGVRHGHLSNGGIGLEDGIDGWAHLGDVVKSIKDAEDVHAGLGCFLDKAAADRVWVRGIAHSIASAQEHLDVLVWHSLAQHVQADPRVLVEEAHGDVISCTTPCLDREQVRGHTGYGFGCRNQGGTTHAGSQQGLVGVAEGGIRNHQRILLTDLLRPLLRTKLEQVISGTARQRLGKV